MEEKIKCESCSELSYCKKNGCYICQKCDDFEEENKQELYSYLTPSIDQINEKIFLGNDDTSRFKDILIQAGITHILICGSELYPHFVEDFTYLKIPLLDSYNEDINKFFEQTNNFIESSKKVYIHCKAGISRSSSVTIAYLMWKNKLNFQKAFDIVKSKRRIICPNDNYLNQLKEYDLNINIQNN